MNKLTANNIPLPFLYALYTLCAFFYLAQTRLKLMPFMPPLMPLKSMKALVQSVLVLLMPLCSFSFAEKISAIALLYLVQYRITHFKESLNLPNRYCSVDNLQQPSVLSDNSLVADLKSIMADSVSPNSKLHLDLNSLSAGDHGQVCNNGET